MNPPRALLAIAAAIALLGVSAASADRRATHDERRAIAKAVDLPKKCIRARISTVTERPKWALWHWVPRAEKCEPFASDGVSVLKFKNGRWRFVTAGSSFTCAELYRDVPRKVVRDFELDCI